LAACWKDPNANAAPIVSGSIANQQGKTGQNFSYTLPENLFSDPDGDALTYSVTLADGSSLPSWLTFNAATRTLSGIPANESIGTLNFKVIATDPGGLSASQDLQLKVEPAKTYNTITGTNSKNTLKGTTKDDHIMGLGGNDTINAGAGDDLLEGGDGTDTLNGEAGHDMLVGGAGNDTLNGGAGNDTYIFDKGWGQDKVTDNDATKGNLDKFIFGEGISSDQLWFKKNGTGLDVMLIGTTDKITITSWYSGSRYQIEQFQTSDGKTLSNTKIDALVSAMAGFAVPAAGQTSLTPQMQAALQPVIAASWQ
jgi:RTX toxins and related Ca2+-binding proteins